MLLVIAKVIAFHRIGNYADHNIKEIFPNSSENEIEFYKYFINKAKRVSAFAIKNGFKSSELIDLFMFMDLIEDDSAKFVLGFAKLSPQTEIFIKGVQTGIDVGFSYWDGEIKKDEAKSELQVFDNEIKKLLLKHPMMTLSTINSAIYKIDGACNK